MIRLINQLDEDRRKKLFPLAKDFLGVGVTVCRGQSVELSTYSQFIFLTATDFSSNKVHFISLQLPERLYSASEEGGDTKEAAASGGNHWRSWNNPST